MLTPQVRIEEFIDAITSDSETPTPQARIEQYLDDIRYGRVSELVPKTRTEQYLAKISGADVDVPIPQTRIEMFLSVLAGEDVETPTPQTRIEMFLAEWIDNSGETMTVTGVPPLTLDNALSRRLTSLVQTGKCEQASTPSRSNPVDIYCNNGALKWDGVNQRIYADGTPEVITVTHADSSTQTAGAENLFAVGNIADEQDIISGTVKRRCEAFLYDGRQTVLDPYLSTTGGKDNGAIIVRPKGAEYSGSIVSLDFDPEDEELGALSVSVNPAQDLHGYANPWPAGGGVNLLDPAKCSVIGPSGAYGLTVTHDQATAIWTISGTPTSQNASLGFNFCTYSDFSLSGKGYQVQAFPISGTPIKNLYGFRNEAENRIAIIIDTVANPTVNMTFKVSVAATAQTAYSPYANICPIVGYDNVTVKKAQRNIWAFNSSFSPSGYAVLVPRNTEFYLPAGTYTFSAIPDIESSSVALGGYYADDTQVTLARLNASEERQSATFTIAKPLYKMYLIANKGGTISDIQLEVGDISTDYEPYTGDTYSITFPSEAGTVYGGTLDVTTGKLTVDRAMVTFDGSTDETWTYSSSYAKTNTAVFYTSVLTDAYYPDWINYRGYIINLFPNATRNYLYDNDVECMGFTGMAVVNASPTVRIFKTRASNETEFRSFLNNNPIQFVYKLATPQTYQLTPTEVAMLLGENNLWSDAGDMKVLVLAPTTETVVGQPLKTTTGVNTLTVTAEVDNIGFDAKYKGTI